MPNYQLGKIYTIRSLSSPEVYVGSTIQNLVVRMAKHRQDYKINKILGLHKEIVKDISEWYIEIFEWFPCNLKCELEKREGEIIREIVTLNINIAGRTRKECKIENAERISEYKKKHYREYKDKVKEAYASIERQKLSWFLHDPISDPVTLDPSSNRFLNYIYESQFYFSISLKGSLGSLRSLYYFI